MLDLTLEFISQAASNSLLVFCFCNLLIVIILVGLKPVSNTHQPVKNSNSNHKGGGETAAERVKNMVKNALIEGVVEESNAQKAAEDVDDEGKNRNNDDDHHGNGRDEKEEEDDDDDDDELRKRVEEFIEKVNEGWKAEVFTSLKPSI